LFNIVPSPPGHYFGEDAGQCEADKPVLSDGELGEIDGVPLAPWESFEIPDQKERVDVYAKMCS